MKRVFFACALLILSQGSLSAAECYCETGDGADGFGFSLNGEYLYWTAFQTNLDYAMITSCIADVNHCEPCKPILKQGKLHFVEYPWNGGFRVTAGFHATRGGWNLKGIWTYFHEKGTNSTTPDELENLQATMIHSEKGPQFAEKATGKNELKYDTADVVFARTFSPGPAIELTPYFGARGLFLDQELTVRYFGGDFTSDAEDKLVEAFIEENCGLKKPPFSGGRVLFRSYYYGVGTHFGLHTSMEFYRKFFLYGNFSASLVAGEGRQSHRQTLTQCVEPIVKVWEKQWIVIPMTQIEAGFTWQGKCFDKGCLNFNLGYAFTHLWNVPHLRRFHSHAEAVSNSANVTAIGIHGGTFGVEISF